MDTALRMDVDRREIIEAVRRMPKQDREDFIEELLSATCVDYLESIREAREDHKAGRVFEHGDLFGE